MSIEQLLEQQVQQDAAVKEKKKKDDRFKKRLSPFFFMFYSALAMLVALVLFSVLIVSSFHKQYYEELFSLEPFVSERFAAKLSRVAMYGIPLGKIAELDNVVEEYREQTKAQSVLVLDSHMSIVAASGYEAGIFFVPSKFDTSYNDGLYFQNENMVWIVQPVLGPENAFLENDIARESLATPETVDHLALEFANHNCISEGIRIQGYVAHGIRQEAFASNLKSLLESNVYILGGVSIFAVFLLCIFVYYVSSNKILRESRHYKVYMYASLIGPLFFAQVIFILTLYTPIRNMQESNMRYMAFQLGTQIADELESLRSLYMPLKDIISKKDYFAELGNDFNWIPMIRVRDTEFEVNILNPYFAKDKSEEEREELCKKVVLQSAESSALLSSVAIGAVGAVDVYISRQNIQDAMSRILMDVVTIMVVTFVFLMEFITIIFITDDTRKKAIANKANKGINSIFDNAQSVRPLGFINFFCVFLASSFISLHMGQISDSFMGLSKEVTMSLPVSIEMFFVGCGIFLGGFFSKKVGWRKLLIYGAILVAIGNVMSAMLTLPALFLASRCVAGFGYGFLNLAPQLFVLEKSSVENRTQSFAFLFAGCFAGLLCSSAVGGLIADRLGYVAVFYTAGGLMALVAALLVRYIPSEQEENKTVSADVENEQVIENANELSEAGPPHLPQNAQPLWKSTLAFLTNIPMAGLLFMHIMPCAFITVCLFNYYIPVALNESGASPADIGRVCMFFSLIVVYVAPACGRLIDTIEERHNDKHISTTVYWLFLSGLIGSLAVFVLSFSENIFVAMLSVSLLGLCNAIQCSAHGVYALSLPVSKTLDDGKVVAIYNVTERVGQVAGPICLGVLLSVIGAEYSLYFIAGTFTCMSFLLLISAFYKK